jgi:hypothetical protein
MYLAENTAIMGIMIAVHRLGGWFAYAKTGKTNT